MIVGLIIYVSTYKIWVNTNKLLLLSVLLRLIIIITYRFEYLKHTRRTVQQHYRGFFLLILYIYISYIDLPYSVHNLYITYI